MPGHEQNFLTVSDVLKQRENPKYQTERKQVFEAQGYNPAKRTFKEPNNLDRALVYTFKLWVKFTDGNARTFYAPCVQTTIDQYQYRQLIDIDFKSGYLVLLDRVQHYISQRKVSQMHLYKTTNNTRIGLWLLNEQIELETPEFKATRVTLNADNRNIWQTYIDLSKL